MKLYYWVSFVTSFIFLFKTTHCVLSVHLDMMPTIAKLIVKGRMMKSMEMKMEKEVAMKRIAKKVG